MDVRHEGRVVVVRPDGDLEAATAPAVRDRLLELTAAGQVRFVVDLSAVDFMDSAGVATLVQLYKRVRLSGGDVRLAAVRPRVRRILELVRLHRLFAFDADPAAAVAALEPRAA